MSISPNIKIPCGSKIVIATHNSGKAKEIEELLKPFQIQIYSAKDLNLTEPEETGSTFHENAKIKALSAAKAANMTALADDSGFCIDALNGDPGLYSARWAGPSKDYPMAMRLIHDKLSNHQNWAAYFISVLCIALPNGKTQEFEGRIDGDFIWPPRGDHGHGYDPVFQPVSYDKTFAEMTDAEKNRISHRALAFQKFIKTCF
ncbi:RdgB/HAM1 family non-canonical purine NTP pyrophosphatase [Commensalibacter oyaizuii]|uniref:dITP/XTP pyrophosphatase n=1 Tax=Commensalibacter oyaizuii TaxID=3043873 RepID=A0ABT6Q3N3_9PROT|nr:RdgB/HAM1 family non-canonical purine NTP pyrophosphatase [Commensalibacter sp. TBRC 16381]MDI2091712.1 RdgB/HAM1 family non-canonical purine NTP pyrophosphatase [Commensalibacter sp. TBRC 16381]